MSYVQTRGVVLDLLRQLAYDGALSIRGLQQTYREADASARDERLSVETRGAAAWLRDQANAELLMAEICYDIDHVDGPA